jgi:DNA-binding GntR family transcriptional regulator
MQSNKAPAEIAYEALRRAIIERAIEPGTKLPEDDLAAQFGISRTPVRAVLARLQAEGLVAGGGRRTASVAEPGLGEARQVFEVRRALEREAVRLVAQRWTPALAQRLQEIVHSEQRAHDAGDLRASSRLAGDFHTVLAEMADNFLLARYMSETVSRCSLILAVHAGPHSNECSIREHEDIIRRFGTGRVEEVMAAMDAHIADIARRALTPADVPEGGRGLMNVLAKYAHAMRAEPLPPAANAAPGVAHTAAKRRDSGPSLARDAKQANTPGRAVRARRG